MELLSQLAGKKRQGPLVAELVNRAFPGAQAATLVGSTAWAAAKVGARQVQASGLVGLVFRIRVAGVVVLKRLVALAGRGTV